MSVYFRDPSAFCSHHSFLAWHFLPSSLDSQPKTLVLRSGGWQSFLGCYSTLISLVVCSSVLIWGVQGLGASVNDLFISFKITPNKLYTRFVTIKIFKVYLRRTWSGHECTRIRILSALVRSDMSVSRVWQTTILETSIISHSYPISFRTYVQDTCSRKRVTVTSKKNEVVLIPHTVSGDRTTVTRYIWVLLRERGNRICQYLLRRAGTMKDTNFAWAFWVCLR